MGLEEVKQEILNKAKKDAEQIVKEAELEAKKIVNEAKGQIEEYKKTLSGQNKAQIANMERISNASANAAAKHIFLEKKKEIIDNAFEEARKQLAKQNKSKKYAEKLLKKAEKEIDVETVYCNKPDADAISKYKVKTIEGINGIIAENKDGTVKVDMTFDTVLNDIKSKSLQEIAKILI